VTQPFTVGRRVIWRAMDATKVSRGELHSYGAKGEIAFVIDNGWNTPRPIRADRILGYALFDFRRSGEAA
jgi:hypothetical protein